MATVNYRDILTPIIKKINEGRPWWWSEELSPPISQKEAETLVELYFEVVKKHLSAFQPVILGRLCTIKRTMNTDSVERKKYKKYREKENKWRRKRAAALKKLLEDC